MEIDLSSRYPLPQLRQSIADAPSLTTEPTPRQVDECVHPFSSTTAIRARCLSWIPCTTCGRCMHAHRSRIQTLGDSSYPQSETVDIACGPWVMSELPQSKSPDLLSRRRRTAVTWYVRFESCWVAIYGGGKHAAGNVCMYYLLPTCVPPCCTSRQALPHVAQHGLPATTMSAKQGPIGTAEAVTRSKAIRRKSCGMEVEG